VCAKDRQPILADPRMRERLVRAWQLADRWVVGGYVIMPDHVHLFCAPGVWPPTPLKAWVDYWKGMVARATRGFGPLVDAGGTAATPSSYGRGGTRPSMAAAPREWPDPLWQRDCWDTQLRRGESYSAKWEYVRHNPVRAGLCAAPDEWPFRGEVNELMWHD
jgi:REP element-mobilizing transposase RayT